MKNIKAVPLEVEDPNKWFNNNTWHKKMLNFTTLFGPIIIIIVGIQYRDTFSIEHAAYITVVVMAVIVCRIEMLRLWLVHQSKLKKRYEIAEYALRDIEMYYDVGDPQPNAKALADIASAALTKLYKINLNSDWHGDTTRD